MTIDSAPPPPASDRSPVTTVATVTFYVASDGSITPTTEQQAKKHDKVVIKLASNSTFAGDIYATQGGRHMCDQLFVGVTADDNYMTVGVTYSVRATPATGNFVITSDPTPGGCTSGTNGDLHVGSGGQGCD